MGFYELSKEERANTMESICQDILAGIKTSNTKKALLYFRHEDTYIRKAAYLCAGRIYVRDKSLQLAVIQALDGLSLHDDFKVRQTVINAAGEIGKKDFKAVQHFFDQGLFDLHYAPRNAVIGSIKKMSAVNPLPVLRWAKKYLQHPDKEIRREICHGIELRGRTHPQDILPMLQLLQHDPTSRVRNTLIHVIGQISYKKDCLETVVQHLVTWQNQELITNALKEIIDVHHRYKQFSILTPMEAEIYIAEKIKF